MITILVLSVKNFHRLQNGTKFYNQTDFCKFATNSKDTVTSSVDRLFEPILKKDLQF